jgi:hypothetical protein
VRSNLLSISHPSSPSISLILFNARLRYLQKRQPPMCQRSSVTLRRRGLKVETRANVLQLPEPANVLDLCNQIVLQIENLQVSACGIQ